MSLAGHIKRLLMICQYDPSGIATVSQTVEYIKKNSCYDITILNLHQEAGAGRHAALPATLDLNQFEGIIIHNTVSYNPYHMRALDIRSAQKLAQYKGIKILLKQDENHLMHQVVEYIEETGFDVIFTCLGESDIPKVYPPERVGKVRFERMLTGYVTPALRNESWHEGERPIDIGYRGSMQSLCFGSLAYEKRQIGNEVLARLKDSDLKLDISSRTEDRIGGEEWFDFMRHCKGVLGSESGASVFDLDGALEQRCHEAEKVLGKPNEDPAYAEAYLDFLKDIEGNVDYAQVSPRHFEAAACGALQILYPGNYSGIFEAGMHYFPLARDFSNLNEALECLRNEPQRRKITDAAYRDIILNPTYWIETFTARFDHIIADTAIKRRSTPRMPQACMHKTKRISRIALNGLTRIWICLPHAAQQYLKPIAKRILMHL